MGALIQRRHGTGQGALPHFCFLHEDFRSKMCLQTLSIQVFENNPPNSMATKWPLDISVNIEFIYFMVREHVHA